MGVQLMEQARLAGVANFVQIGTVCSYPKFMLVPLREDDLRSGYAGVASREFVYVDDAAEGSLLAAKRYDGADPVNLGTGQEMTIRELVGLITRLTAFEGEVRWDSTKSDGLPRRALDTSRARERFGFVALSSLEEGLRRAIDSNSLSAMR